MITNGRVIRAYRAVLNGKVRFPLTEIARVYNKLHFSEFFTDAETDVVHKIELLMEKDDGQRGEILH